MRVSGRIQQDIVLEPSAMHRLRRFIALLIVGVLGLQTGAMAMHVHFPDVSSAVHAAVDEQHARGDRHSSPAAEDASSHHSASCIAAQSCFPVGHAVGLMAAAAPMHPVVPAPAATAALPLPRPDNLLRPPRYLG